MATHWWKTDRLVADLAAGAVAERDALRYMMISAVQYQVVLYLAAWYGNWRGWQLVAELGVVLIISVIGVRECFKANGGVQGRHFILRYCALGVPLALKLAIASILLGLVLSYGSGSVINATTFRDPLFVHRFLAFVLALLFTFIFYWRLAYHLARVVKRERSNPSLHTDVLQPASPPVARG